MSSINVTDIVSSNSSGVFDKLILAIRTQLQAEFSDGRITGTEYSKVYATTLDAVLNQSINFALQKGISAAQADLLVAQRALAVTQELAVVAEIALTNANTAKVNREVSILDKQEILLDKQIIKLTVEGELLTLEKTKTTAEVALINAQILNAAKQLEIATAQLVNLPKEGLLLDKNAAKTQEETTFLSQRIKSEKAQILDDVDNAAVTGILGRQRALYEAQSNGFVREAEFKVMKAMMDIYTINKTVDEFNVTGDNNNKLHPTAIGNAVTKCFAGIGITPGVAP